MSKFKISAAGTFALPDYYDWKPFFTIQPIEATRAKQLKLWCDLIIAYFDHHKDVHTFVPSTFGILSQLLTHSLTHSLTPSLTHSLKLLSKEYFKNDKIQRELSPAGVNLVIHELIAAGYAEWDDSNQISLRIIRVSPDILATSIYEWVKNNVHGQFNEVSAHFLVFSVILTHSCNRYIRYTACCTTIPMHRFTWRIW